jgi:hypothetical protein
MDSIDARLREHGLTLPDLAPTHEFVAVKLLGDIALVSGHASFIKACSGLWAVWVTIAILNKRVSLQEKRYSAVFPHRHHFGSLDRVTDIVKMNGYVKCGPHFPLLPRVTDGASALLLDLWGERGRHARTTVGVAELPAGVAVEIELVVKFALPPAVPDTTT